MLNKTNHNDYFRPFHDEFRSSSMEESFRSWSYHSDNALIRSYLLLALFVISMFLAVDLGLNELSIGLYPILAGRIILLTIYATILYLISKSISIKYFDYIICFSFLTVSAYELFIIYSLPKDFLLHLGIDIIIIFLCYIAIPISVMKKIFITFSFTALNLYLLFYYKENTYQITYTGYTLSIITANLLGYLISIQQGRLKRTNYLLLIKEKKALEEIKTLKGVIPICSYCRNIRDDKGAWKELESYIDENLDTQFSHGICPNCIVDAKSDSGLEPSNN